MPRRALTPLERLINTSLGGLMGQRVMVARHGRTHHGLRRIEDTVILTHMRLSRIQGKVITATSLAEDLLVDRKAAERGLKKLVALGRIVIKGKEGKEVVYDNPPGYDYPTFLVDDLVLLVADQRVLGDRLKPLVAALDDHDLKNRIAKAVAVKMTT